MGYNFNSYQTELTDELLKSLHKETRADIIEYLENIPFLQHMSDPNRPYAKDVEKDEEGKIIVNITKPHILENMDYFRPAALYYKKHGVYTHIYPSKAPNGPYRRYWKEEARRCREGYVRESDGEWISGYYYFYLNYSVIQKVLTKEGSKRADRITDFPNVYDGDYLFFHYLEAARNAGKHTATLKKRGSGFEQPYSEEVITPYGISTVGDMNVGDYLISREGNKTKILKIFEQGEKDVYEVELLDGRKVKCGVNHLWEVLNTKNKKMIVTTEYLLKNGLKSNNNVKKDSYKYKIPLNKPVKYDTVSNIIIKPYTLGVMLGDGTISSKGLRISSNDFEIIAELRKENPDYNINKLNDDEYRYSFTSKTKGFSRLTREFKKLNLLDKNTYNKFIPDEYKYGSVKDRLELVKGLLDTDGTSSPNGSVRFTNTSEQLIDDLSFILRSLGYRVKKSKTNQGGKVVKFNNGCSSIQKECWILNIITEDNLFKLSRKSKNIKIRNYNTSVIPIKNIIKLNYKENSRCFLVDNDEHLYLTKDFIVTHNSFKGGSKLARNFITGESMEATNNVKSYAIADEKEFLTKDGVLNKFIDIADFLAETTPFPGYRGLKNSWQEMHWKMGYKDKILQIDKGVKNEIFGVTLKNDPEKARGKRGALIEWEEAGKFNSFLRAWQIARPSVEEDGFAFGLMNAYGCLVAGSKVWNNKGELVNIEELNVEDGIVGHEITKGMSKEKITHWKAPVKKDCIKITTNSGRSLECSTDHPILWSRQDFGTQPRVDGKRPFVKKVAYVEAINIQLGDQVAVIEEVDIWSDKVMWDPYLVGMLIGDGSYGINKTPVLSNCDKEVNDYITNKYNTVIERSHITKEGKEYRETRIKGITKELKELGIYGQTKSNKTLPLNCHSYSKETVCKLISGLFDADGYYGKKAIVLTSAYKNLLLEVQLLLQKLGIHGNISEVKAKISKNRLDVNNYYRFEIKNKSSIDRYYNSITSKIEYKQKALDNLYKYYKLIKKRDSESEYVKGIKFERVVEVKETSMKPVYNLTTSKTHSYVGNGIITHNTGGTEGADFFGLQEIFYNPLGYNILGLPNVYDKNVGEGTKCSFFFATYMNANGFYDKDGNSDVIGATLYRLKEKLIVKYETSDPNAVVQYMAENPITPQDAIMRTEGSRFPIMQLKNHLSEIMPNLESFCSSHFIGELKLNKSGELELDMMGDYNPVRKFPLTDNKNKQGCLEIFEKPIARADGTIPRGRYIAGCDPYDDDESTTNSLGSLFVFDVITDRIVAEYTGRPDTAKEFYKNIHYILKYYNAICNYENDKKGLYAYMENHGGLHYLADNPQILKDMEVMKPNYYGNKSKGTNSGKQINRFGRSLLADWMLDEAYRTESEAVDEEGNPISDAVPNLFMIRSIGLINEAIAWNIEGNYDRISAMGMLMILREDRAKIEVSVGKQKSNNIANDKFFNSHFKQFNHNR